MTNQPQHNLNPEMEAPQWVQDIPPYTQDELSQLSADDDFDWGGIPVWDDAQDYNINAMPTPPTPQGYQGNPTPPPSQTAPSQNIVPDTVPNNTPAPQANNTADNSKTLTLTNDPLNIASLATHRQKREILHSYLAYRIDDGSIKTHEDLLKNIQELGYSVELLNDKHHPNKAHILVNDGTAKPFRLAPPEKTVGKHNERNLGDGVLLPREPFIDKSYDFAKNLGDDMAWIAKVTQRHPMNVDEVKKTALPVSQKDNNIQPTQDNDNPLQTVVDAVQTLAQDVDDNQPKPKKRMMIGDYDLDFLAEQGRLKPEQLQRLQVLHDEMPTFISELEQNFSQYPEVLEEQKGNFIELCSQEVEKYLLDNLEEEEELQAKQDLDVTLNDIDDDEDDELDDDYVASGASGHRVEPMTIRTFAYEQASAMTSIMVDMAKMAWDKYQQSKQKDLNNPDPTSFLIATAKRYAQNDGMVSVVDELTDYHRQTIRPDDLPKHVADSVKKSQELLEKIPEEVRENVVFQKINETIEKNEQRLIHGLLEDNHPLKSLYLPKVGDILKIDGGKDPEASLQIAMQMKSVGELEYKTLNAGLHGYSALLKQEHAIAISEYLQEQTHLQENMLSQVKAKNKDFGEKIAPPPPSPNQQAVVAENQGLLSMAKSIIPTPTLSIGSSSPKPT